MTAIVGAALLIAGAHVPTILFVEVVGKAGILAPLQKGPTGSKVGVMFPLTVTVATWLLNVLTQLPTATDVRLYTKVPIALVGAATVTELEEFEVEMELLPVPPIL